MESNKRKRETIVLTTSPQNKFRRKSEGIINDSGKMCTVTLNWSQRNTAYLLKCIYKRINFHAHIDIKNDNDFWQEIEKDMKEKYSWAFTSICQMKWKNLKEEMEKYIANQNARSQPEFYYVVREVIRLMSLKKEENCKSEDEEDSSDDDRADPDAGELEPFAGVMDSLGNLFLREPLIEIINSYEADSHATDATIAERHGVEEAIVEWVKENQGCVLKGSLRCSTCNRNIFKRETFIHHELDCLLTADRGQKDDGGFLISYENNDMEEPWSTEIVATLIKVFKERASSYVNSEGVLRKGIWMEILKRIKPLNPKITPPMCHDKWVELVNIARSYSVSLKNKVDCNTILACPTFFNEVADIVDLENFESGSPHSLIPKELVPLDKGKNITPRVFLSRQDHEDEEEYELSEEELLGHSYDSTNDSVSVSSEAFNDAEYSSIKNGKLYMEQKLQSLNARIKELEDENLSLRHQQQPDNYGALIPSVLSKLDQFLHTQHRAQVRQTEILTHMTSMWERHHKENMTILKTLIHDISKWRTDIRRNK